jgi:hypothetical protein
MNKHSIHQLNKLAGRWKTTGSVISTGQKIEGTDTYEWLFGHFQLHKADVMIGSEKSETFEIISYDKENDCFLMDYYNNKGETGRMKAIIENDLWIFTHDQLQFKGGFSITDHVFSGIWSQKDESGTWQPFIEIHLKKIG